MCHMTLSLFLIIKIKINIKFYFKVLEILVIKVQLEQNFISLFYFSFFYSLTQWGREERFEPQMFLLKHHEVLVELQCFQKIFKSLKAQVTCHKAKISTWHSSYYQDLTFTIQHMIFHFEKNRKPQNYRQNEHSLKQVCIVINEHEYFFLRK